VIEYSQCARCKQRRPGVYRTSIWCKRCDLIAHGIARNDAEADAIVRSGGSIIDYYAPENDWIAN
jgi:hypothetical protein